MATPKAGWTEADSQRFIDDGAVFVPSREEQIASLCALIPARPDEAFTVAELGAGAGVLARAVLDAFPRCRYIALDGSPAMRARLNETLHQYRPRVDVRPFDLTDRGWRAALPRPLHAVLASLVVHHLPAAGKRRLFGDLARRLEPGGALLLADIVEPPNLATREAFARQWADAARAQSLALTGGLQAFERFEREGWNFYRGTPEAIDQPSRLDEQLRWLGAAGFARVDCTWMRAGHAVFGGWRRRGAPRLRRGAPSGAGLGGHIGAPMSNRATSRRGR
ncbi:MAG TPA: class I SAM-dependent methyltransferase [Methylomirabilota bacterium]|nr:class I SAM-dependent methyltransferase [Methylomirabilota bacterium]